MKALPISVVAMVGIVALSAQTNESRDALFAAIRSGSVPEVERLLTGGASTDGVDADGTPALMAATLFGGADLVKLLLDRGADPNRPGVGGTTALMWAVPNLEKVRLLVARGANVNAQSDTGRTPLLVAAGYPGTVDVLQLMLRSGADLRAQDKGGTTALALAIRASDISVVRFLVERGLDPDALTPPARRAGLLRNDQPTADFLLSRTTKNEPELLAAAATWQPVNQIARWIDAGGNVNATLAAQYARTPLMNAVSSEAEGAEALKLLLEKGANPNAEMTEGERPLDWALYKGDTVKIQVLEQYGAQRGRGPRRDEIAPPAAGGAVDARVALGKSLARLMDVAPRFRDQATCISCHHNAMPAIAAAAARSKGIEFDEVKARKNLDDIRTFFGAALPRMMLGDAAVGGEAITAGYSQMALRADGQPLDTTTAAITHWLLARQMPDGRWLGNGLNRPPSEYSVISHTALAAGGLKSYPVPGRRPEIDESLRRARNWLLAADAKSAEERGMRLMGLVWTDAPRGRVDEAVRAIREKQETSGGWSQFGRTVPDAYATGVSLYALHVAGVPATDEAYRKGVAFLLSTQYPDGTWLVRTHSFPVQRYFESGFPYGRHQWISTAGTSWASLAISQTLPDKR
ncbi:MAG TPA: ankyrin repeat domain-containing protein [Vicinamibacterales bacterium]|nr:ankyrin repeat domain-containing protein [Vicinamibacterales bacterium]